MAVPTRCKFSYQSVVSEYCRGVETPPTGVDSDQQMRLLVSPIRGSIQLTSSSSVGMINDAGCTSEYWLNHEMVCRKVDMGLNTCQIRPSSPKILKVPHSGSGAVLVS